MILRSLVMYRHYYDSLVNIELELLRRMSFALPNFGHGVQDPFVDYIMRNLVQHCTKRMCRSLKLTLPQRSSKLTSRFPHS
jgi:transcriptional antiterminator